MLPLEIKTKMEKKNNIVRESLVHAIISDRHALFLSIILCMNLMVKKDNVKHRLLF